MVGNDSKMEDIIDSIKNTKVDLKKKVGEPVEAVKTVYEGTVDAYNSSSKKLNLSKNDYFALAGNYMLTADSTGVTWNGQTIKWSDKYPDSVDGKSYEEEIQNGTNSLRFKFNNGPYFQVGLNPNATLSGITAALNGATFDIINTGNVVYALGLSGSSDLEYEVNSDVLGIKNDTWEKLGYDLHDVYNVPLNQSLNIDSSNLLNTKAVFSDGVNSIEFELVQESRDKLADIINNRGGIVSANEQLSLKFQSGNSEKTFYVKPLQEKSLMETLKHLDTVIKDSFGYPCSFTELSVNNFKIKDISQGNIGNNPVSYDFEITQPNLPVTSVQDEKSHSLWIQSGCEAGQGMWLEIDTMNTSILGINDLDVSTVDGANHAIDAVQGALDIVSSSRSKIGAQQNRLEHTISNNQNNSENTTAAESRIRDTDIADEMVKFSKESILENVGQAMLAQSNQFSQNVLSLLQ